MRRDAGQLEKYTQCLTGHVASGDNFRDAIFFLHQNGCTKKHGAAPVPAYQKSVIPGKCRDLILFNIVHIQYGPRQLA